MSTSRDASPPQMAGDKTKANIPRQGQRQTLTGLDSYHQFMVQSSRNAPRPRAASNDRLQRPYAPDTQSFSKPRPAHTPSSSTGSSNLPENFGTNGTRPNTRGTFINSQANAIRYASPPPSRETFDTSELADITKSDRLVEATLPWRPVYMRRRILLCFLLLFACLAAVVEILLHLSNRNTGVAWPRERIRYAWQFGPAAVAILTTAMWARVEYQAKATAPWHRMARGPASLDTTLLLDYPSMWQPWVILESIRNRDWLVTVTSTTGMLLRLLIIASVALVVPVLADVQNNAIGFRLTDAFTGDGSSMRDAGFLAVNSVVALQSARETLPDGLDAETAFQSFRSDLPATALLRATVDGFQADLDCEPANLTLTSVELIGRSTTQLNIQVSTDSCVTTHQIQTRLLESNEGANVPRVFMRFREGNCNSSTIMDGHRIVVMSGTLTLDPNGLRAQNVQIAGAVPQSGAVMCKPSYSVAPFEVVRNGTQIIASRRVVGSEARNLSDVSAWDLAEVHFDAWAMIPGIVGLPRVDSLYSGQAVVDSDSIMDAVFAGEAARSGAPQLGNLVDPATLGRISGAYWRRYSAFLAKASLARPATGDLQGEATLTGERLVVKEIPAHLMAAILGLSVFLTIAADYLVPRQGLLPRSPSTIIGMATLLSHSRPLLQCLRGAGAADEAALRERLSGSKYYTGVEAYEKSDPSHIGYFKILGGHPPPQAKEVNYSHTGDWKRPLALRLWARLALISVTFTMIIALEIILRFSDRQVGFAAVLGGEYVYLIWTTVVAVLFASVALYACTADFETRLLAPYAKLRFGGSLATTAGLDFTDRAKLPVIWSAIRTGNPSVVVTAITAILAGSLVIFTSSLFTAIPATATRSIALQSVDFFADAVEAPLGLIGGPAVLDRDVAVASLILHSNLSFPASTFQDLNIPSLELEEPLPDAETDVDEARIRSVLRVLRPDLQCQLYPTSEISTNLTLDAQISNITDPLRIDVISEPCRVDDSELLGSNVVISTTGARTSSGSAGFFGRATTRSNNLSQCSDLFFTWGHLENDGPDNVRVSHVSAMGCNETLQTVTADVTFLGADLRINPETPPRVMESTAVNNAVGLSPLQYDGLMDMRISGNVLDPFFSSLTTSRFAIPASLLGDSSLDIAGMVADAVVAQHKLLRTQSLNLRARRSITEDGEFPRLDNGDRVRSGLDPAVDAATAQPRLVATLTTVNPGAARRLQVDELTVRILQVILSAVLLGGLASLILALIGSGGVLGVGILPRRPGSIASVAALLADGNVFGYLPRGAEWMSCRKLDEDMQQKGVSADFSMGWETRKRRRRDEISRLGLPPEMRQTHEEFGVRIIRGGGAEAGAVPDWMTRPTT